MVKVLILLISGLCLSWGAETITFKELTELVSKDLKKNIYLDIDVSNYTVEFNIAEHQNRGELYEFYKVVLFSHDLKLVYNQRGNFYYVQKRKKEKDNFLEERPRPAPADQLHYYTYKIKHITNQDVIDCMSIFTNVKFKYLKQSDIIAYSSTLQQHKQIEKILRKSDNKVQSKTIKITIFSIDKSRLKEMGATIGEFGLDFSQKANATLLDKFVSKFTFNSEFESDIYLKWLNRFGITKVEHSPTILLSNGVEAQIDSVTNIRYLLGTATVDNDNSTVTQNYTFKDVGLKIKLMPKIKDNWIYLNLSLTSEEIISFEADNPTTGKISYQNAFKIVKGKPLLLTGINKKITKTTEEGIPFLKDIPFLKQLFSGKKMDLTESNINILIEVL